MKAQIKQHAVLVVAPEMEEIGTIVRALDSENYDFITAKTVPEALSSITYRLPNIIISDTDLPDVNGFRFLEIIRKGVKTRIIPFIFISNSKALKERVHAYQTGADAILEKPIIPEELRALVASRIRMIEDFYHVAMTDDLTRLYNRKEFFKKFNEEIQKTPKQSISLALLDLDHFKQINDVHGHQMGDNVLMTFAEVIKSFCGEKYLPARFGGEEFVILFPGLSALEAKDFVDQIRSIFCGISFQGDKQKVFRSNFSAGVAEYPLMANNLSQLLSKADQALYAAKNEGRGRTLVYSPLMGRNDRFWEYLKANKEIFVTKENIDVVSGLPYLPEVLEIITNLDFEIQSIGAMAIAIKELPDIFETRGRQNLHYDIRNIVKVIMHSCENNFASDTFYCRANIFYWDFVILFPSVADFSFNLKKFKELCTEIFQSIYQNPATKNFELGFSCDVLYYNKKAPWLLLDDVNRIMSQIRVPQKKQKSFGILRRSMHKFINNSNNKGIIKTRYFYNTFTFHNEYQYLVIEDNIENNTFSCEFDVLTKGMCKLNKISSAISHIRHNINAKKALPLMMPWFQNWDLIQFVDVVSDVFKGWNVLLMINESQISERLLNKLTYLSNHMPTNISIAIDNCFIGQDLLNVLSSLEFKALCFSENIIRNISVFRERIKIINGIKIFADQLGIRVMAKNVLSEEEYIIVRDLGIYYASGEYLEIFKKSSISAII